MQRHDCQDPTSQAGCRDNAARTMLPGQGWDKTAWAGKIGEDSQQRTVGKRQPARDDQNLSGRTGQADSTGRTRQSEQDRQIAQVEIVRRTGLAEQACQDRTARKGLPRQGC